MLFRPIDLVGAYLIEPEPRTDDRGSFARIFCENEFAALGLATRFVQANNSCNFERGVLRGMHYQLPPHAETKLVRCVRGSLWDCILDLRPDSPSLGKWFAAELTAENRLMMYVPKGFAHGFLTLTPDAEALYLVDEFYSRDAERIVRWNDPFFGINWPDNPVSISEKDASAPNFDPAYHCSAAEGY